MAKTFAGGLRGYLDGKKRLNRWESRLRKVLDKPPSRLKDWFLRTLEARVREHLKIGATAAIDWGSIDWAAVLTAVLQFLLMILPLIL